MNRTTALIAAGALVAAPLATVVAAAPASADTTKRGVCGPGTYEFQVDREDREDGVLVKARVPRSLTHRFSAWSVNGRAA